jgi:hypothetical protein
MQHCIILIEAVNKLIVTLLSCSWNIEKKAKRFYTREVFVRFQEMFLQSTRYYPIQAEQEGLNFDLVPNEGLGIKMYRVQVVLAEGLYTCACNTLEMCGLVCPHIVRVMVHLNIQEIPSRYMLKWWSVEATTPAPDPGSNTARFGVPASNTLKYNALCKKMCHLASDACFADDTYAIVSNMVDEASRIVATMRRTRNELGMLRSKKMQNMYYSNSLNQNMKILKHDKILQHMMHQTVACCGTRLGVSLKVIPSRRKKDIRLWLSCEKKRLKRGRKK